MTTARVRARALQTAPKNRKLLSLRNGLPFSKGGHCFDLIVYLFRGKKAFGMRDAIASNVNISAPVTTAPMPAIPAKISDTKHNIID
jgi:hypothetical protein